MKYWHVIKTKNSIKVTPKLTMECKDVKGSIACYLTRSGAIADLNTRQLK